VVAQTLDGQDTAARAGWIANCRAVQSRTIGRRCPSVLNFNCDEGGQQKAMIRVAMSLNTSKQTRTGALRTLVGFALMPPSAAIIAVPLYAVMYAAGFLPRGAPIDSLDSALGLGTGVAILAVVITVFCALPAVNWLNEHRLLSPQRLLVLGAVLGNVPLAIIVVVIVVVQLARGSLSQAVGQYWYGLGGAVVRVGMGTIVGMGSALILWLVAIEDNDRWNTSEVPVGRRPVPRPPRRRNDAAH
jgi:hypothetical protein